MPAETIVLRDHHGRLHRIELTPDGMARLDGTAVTVRPGPDGCARVEGPANALAWTAVVGDTRWVFVNGQVFTFERERPNSRRRTASHHGTLMAPMPATVRKLLVSVGDRVGRNDVLVVLEAMKMELPIRATADGAVAKVNCREGELVQPGVSLIELAD